MIALALLGAMALHDGDRVLFYGDSITEHQRYTAYVEAFVRCRVPSLKVEFTSAGWAGDTAHGTSGWDEAGGTAEERVDKDVAPRHPTLVTVMLGMNDAGYYPLNPEWLKGFESEYGSLLTRISAVSSHPRLCLFAPTPWDDFTRPPSYPQNVPNGGGGYNDTLVAYGKAIREIAAKRGAGFVDLNDGMARALRFAAAENPKLAQSLVSDWIHPDWSGALIPAVDIVESWGVPKRLSSVELDAAARTVRSEGARVEGFDGLRWRQLDESLPLPYDNRDAATALAARSCRIEERMNAERLVVKGLQSGSYELSIDGRKIGSFEAGSLASGIELGTLETPMRRQSMAVLDLVKQKNQVQFARWRDVERRYRGAYRSTASVLSAMSRLEAEIEDRIRQSSRPVWHRYQLNLTPSH